MKKLNSILKRIKKRALRKKLDYDLDLPWLRLKLKEGKCEATGLQFKLKPFNDPCHPSIDRIDSSKGYTKDNCQLVALEYNMLKSNYDITTILNFCKGFVRKYDEAN